MSKNATSMSQSPYEALPVSRREIRVLEVAPGNGNDMIKCKMKRISLRTWRVRTRHVRAYETISYCWGAPRDPSTIELNGHLTPVPASSEAAVRRMRLSDRPRVLWIDAICIDQSSTTERSAQVALMATVYSTAQHNLVYLGEDDDDMAERAVKALEDVLDDMRTVTADFTQVWETTYGKSGAPLYSNEPFSASVDFESLEALFNHHWFR